MLAGVDGYKKRWIVALDSGDGFTQLELVDSFADLLRRSDLEVVLIDVPIGLPDHGARGCDRLARTMIGPRRNSVFSAPIRSMLGATSWEDACQRRHLVEGKRVSKQVSAILPLIESVDAQMTPSQQRHVREGHPEVSFAALAGTPMQAPKRKREGRAQRLRLLRAEFPDIEKNIAEFSQPGAITDILDAYVLLWSAIRVSRHQGESLPAEPEYDSRGLRMEIVY